MWHEIQSTDELNEIISEQNSGKYNLILKHSTRCGISTMAKGRIEKNPDSRLGYFIINVLTHRDVSNSLAEMTGVQHESPQAFLFQENSLLDVKSHNAIRPDEFSQHLDKLIEN